MISKVLLDGNGNHITQELFFNAGKHTDIILTLGGDIGVLPKKDQNECEGCLHSTPPIPPLPLPCSCPLAQVNKKKTCQKIMIMMITIHIRAKNWQPNRTIIGLKVL
ncbi:MAG: hypothetical protein JO327_07515 [Nitrososphaeraceae archaeon]|nr:hypothetical protein [Nitrososphaeraceae archaeon]